MKKVKRIAAMTAALLICSGVMGYMPQGALKIGGFAANAAGDAVAESVAIDATNFPDAIFREYVAKNFDKNNDGMLSDNEIEKATSISIGNKGITDLTGVNYFTNLKTLDCTNNRNLKKLDIGNNTVLSTLFCEYTQLTSLNTSNNLSLKKLYCSHSNLETLDVSNNTELVDLYCDYNQLKTLDVSNNTKLEYLSCEKNNFTSLDVSNNTALKYFACDTNQLTTLDISNNTALEFFDCNTNHLTSIDLSNNPSLYGSSGCILNEYEISLENNTFDLSALPAGFDVTKASEWTNGTVNGSILTVEDVSKEVTYVYDCGNNSITIFKLIPPLAAEISPVSVAIDETHFPDAVFRQYVTDNFDIDANELLSAEEIKEVTEIKVSNKGISDLTGIEHFKKLKKLQCDNNKLTTLDINKNTSLHTLLCNNNQLTTLDLSNNITMYMLKCEKNHLTSLDLNKQKILLFKSFISNKYEIAVTNKTFDLSTLPTGFDITKASDWTNGTVNGNILTVEDTSKEVTYKYDCGNEQTATFTLIPTTSTETPENPPVSTPTYSTGDISGDGSIDSSDATLVLADYAVIATGGTSTFNAEQAKAADVNGDGKYDAIDASLILAYYAYTSTGGTGSIEDYLADMN